MMQFFETYRDQPKLSALLRELSWSHNLAIMSRSKRDEERKSYLRMATRERWSFRELQRQLNGALVERVVLAPPKLSAPLTELHPEAGAVVKDRTPFFETYRGRPKLATLWRRRGAHSKVNPVPRRWRVLIGKGMIPGENQLQGSQHASPFHRAASNEHGARGRLHHVVRPSLRSGKSPAPVSRVPG
jgi:predicted nuclease of restriction endonuclease-like (RecB) superfamily